VAKKRGGMSPEEWAEWEARSDRTTRLLEERLAYHEAKIAEENAARERAERRARARRERFRRLVPFG
jgi:hypothetical protein